MAVYYCKPGITLGTGSGTIGDPWNIQETLSSANTNGLVQGDSVAVMTDGVTYEAATAPLHTPLAQTMIFPVDYSGNPTRDRWMINAAGAGGLDGLNIDKSGCLVLLPEIINAPIIGIEFSAGGDRSNLWGALVKDCGGKGIVIPNLSDNSHLSSCQIIDAGSIGIEVGDTLDHVTIEHCYVKHSVNSSSVPAIDCRSQVANSIIEIDATGLTSFKGINCSHGSGTFGGLVAKCTFVITGDTSSLSAASPLVDMVSTAWTGGAVVDCLFHNEGSDNANITCVEWSGYSLVSAQMWNNVKNGIASGFTGTVGTDLRTAPTDTDPLFVDVATSDFRPQVDLSTTALVKKIAEEGVDWRSIGALSDKLVAGGGGGGTVFRGVKLGL